MLCIDQLKISHQKNKPIIKNFNLNLKSGDILAMLGNSGSGKTSVLNSIAGLIDIDQGKITVNGVTLNAINCHVPPERRGVGMVFQDNALFPHLNVEKNITFGLKYLNKVEKKQRVSELLSLVDLSGIESKYPHQLSGGEQQRVALVRSLALKPKVLLLDEPFSNLDSSHKMTLIKQVRKILKQENMTAIFVTHNNQEATMLADDIAHITDGKLISQSKNY